VFAILLKEAKVRALCPHAVPSSITHSPPEQSPRDALLSCPRQSRRWMATGEEHAHAGIGADPADGGNADASWAAAAGDRIAAGHYQ
jgi:hypothetical protein